MAQGDGLLHNEWKRAVMAGEIDMDGGHTLKLGMLTGYTRDIDTHLGWADVSANEVTNVSGYTAGGATVASPSVDLNSGNDRGDFDAENVTWSSLEVAETPSHVCLYDDSHASKVIIATWEVTTVTNGGDYTIQWNASGIVTLT